MNKLLINVYEFIIDFIISNGYSPSVREIAEEIGVSNSTVLNRLFMLERLGKINTHEGKCRAISVVGYEFRKAEKVS